MKNQHSRILAWLLVFSMVLAMMPAMLITASADEPVSAATWAKTDLKDIKSTDTVAITMTRGEVTYALPTTIDAEKKVALALVCTVKGNTLTMSGKTRSTAGTSPPQRAATGITSPPVRTTCLWPIRQRVL